MMAHLTDGQLRAYLDGETCEGFSLLGIEKHLKGCQDCQTRLEQMKIHVSTISGQLGFLSPLQDKTDYGDREIALVALKKLESVLEKKENSMTTKILNSKFRPLWVGVMIIAFLVILFSLPSGPTWAGQFLGLFRVQEVKLLPIDTSTLERISSDETMGKRMGELISKSIVMKKEPAKPHYVTSVPEANQAVGFTLRLPSQPISDPGILVQDSFSYDMVVDQKRIQSFIDEFGRKDLVLPENLDGATISVDIPAGISIGYGDCPKIDLEAKENKKPSDQPEKVHFPDCVMLAEIPSPTVNTPPDLDIAKLAELGLEFAGMKPEEAQAYTQTVDWTTSLVVPIPKQGTSVEQITVDGVNGTLLKHDEGVVPRYSILWIKDSVIYGLNGWGTDATKALEMANSFK
jgi:hypothetical protein